MEVSLLSQTVFDSVKVGPNIIRSAVCLWEVRTDGLLQVEGALAPAAFSLLRLLSGESKSQLNTGGRAR